MLLLMEELHLERNLKKQTEKLQDLKILSLLRKIQKLIFPQMPQSCADVNCCVSACNLCVNQRKLQETLFGAGSTLIALKLPSQPLCPDILLVPLPSILMRLKAILFSARMQCAPASSLWKNWHKNH